MNTQPQSLYEQDYYQWTVETANSLKSKSYGAVDVEHLIEEIESMGASQTRQLESRLEVLIMHLLKWQYQPSLQGRSWKKTIIEQRKRIKRLLQKMPSLKSSIDDEVLDAYDYARDDAIYETGLSESIFPKEMPYSLEQILDDNFYPESQ